MQADANLSKLSVAELRKQIFWCGATLPSGTLEKSDLVTTLRKHLVEKDQREAEKARKEREQANETAAKVPNAVPRPAARPLNYAQKATSKEQQDVVDFHILPEEELKRRLEKAGGEVPEGEVGKFWLVSALKNAIRTQEVMEEQLAEQVKEAAEAQVKAVAAAKESAARAAAVAAAAEAAVAANAAAEAEAARKAEAAARCLALLRPYQDTGAGDAEDDVEFDDRDPAELSAKELRRRLRAYGARGEEKLRGLSEKHEFVTALREAIAEWGPPPRRQQGQASTGEQVAADPMPSAEEAKPQIQPDAPKVAAQPERSKAAVDDDLLKAAANAGRDAVQAAEQKKSAEGACPPAAEPASLGKENGSGGKVSARAAARRDRAAKKRQREACEVVLSDGEDEVCPVVAAPISIEEVLEDDDEVSAVQPTAPSGKAAKRQRRAIKAAATAKVPSVEAPAKPQVEPQAVGAGTAGSVEATADSQGGGTWL